MISNFQFLEQHTSNLLERKAKQAAEAEQLDERIDKAKRSLQKSLFTAHELRETIKEKRIEGRQAALALQKAEDDLKQVAVRKEGLILLLKEDLVKGEAIRETLKAQYTERTESIRAFKEKCEFIEKCCEHKRKVIEQKAVEERMRFLRNLQSQVDEMQTNMISFIQRLPTEAQYEESQAELERCTAEVEIERSAVNEVTLQLKEVEAEKASLEEELCAAHDKKAILKQTLSELEQKVEDERAKIADLQKKDDELKESLNEGDGVTRDYESKIALLTEEIQTLHVQADATRKRITEKKAFLEQCPMEEELELQQKAAADRIEAQIDKGKELVASIIEFKHLIPKMIEYRNAEVRLAELQKNLEDRQAEETAARTIFEAQRKAAVLAESIENLVNQERVSRAILEESHLDHLKKMSQLIATELDNRFKLIVSQGGKWGKIQKHFVSGRKKILAAHIDDPDRTPPLILTPPKPTTQVVVTSSAKRKKLRRFLSPSKRAQVSLFSETSLVKSPKARGSVFGSRRTDVSPKGVSSHGPKSLSPFPFDAHAGKKEKPLKAQKTDKSGNKKGTKGKKRADGYPATVGKAALNRTPAFDLFEDF